MVLAACADDPEPTPAAPDEEVVPDRLTILEWAGYELEEFYPAFLDRYPDVELDFQFGDSDADFLTKAQTGAAEPHVVHPCAGWVGLWQAAGLAHPIDPERLEHWESLDPSMRELGMIDGEPYFVPFDWGYTSLAVAVDRVDRVPTSWRDLWDPQYRDRNSIWDDPEEAVVLTATAWGLDPYDLSEEELQFVREKLQELHRQVKTYWTASFEVNQLLIDGEVDVAQAWTESLAAMLDAGIDAEYIEPVEGRLGWVCGFIVTAGPDRRRGDEDPTGRRRFGLQLASIPGAWLLAFLVVPMVMLVLWSMRPPGIATFAADAPWTLDAYRRNLTSTIFLGSLARTILMVFVVAVSAVALSTRSPTCWPGSPPSAGTSCSP